MLEELIKIANRLDEIGETESASKIDSLLLSLASDDEGEIIHILNPSGGGISSAYRDDEPEASVDKKLLEDISSFLLLVSEDAGLPLGEIQDTAGKLFERIYSKEEENSSPEEKDGQVIPFPMT